MAYPPEDNGWEATITPMGHGQYHIAMSKGIMADFEGRIVFGRKRAEKKARKLIDKYNNADAREAQKWTIS